MLCGRGLLDRKARARARAAFDGSGARFDIVSSAVEPRDALV
jgi:hypothetical protein